MAVDRARDRDPGLRPSRFGGRAVDLARDPESGLERSQVRRAGCDGATVRVEDDGPGISAAEADKLFDLYFRSEASAPAPGSGIGLFVCRQLVAAMGGRIWAKPRESGGAEFGFSLPLWIEEPSAEISGAPTSAWGPLERMDIGAQTA